MPKVLLSPASTQDTPALSLCCRFYFNLKQMVTHTCEQLWPLAHGAGTGFEHAPFPTHWPIRLVPSSPSPLAWPSQGQLTYSKVLSYVPATGEHLAGQALGTLRPVVLGHVPGGEWSNVASSLPPFPLRTQRISGMGSEAWVVNGKRQGSQTPPSTTPRHKACLSRPRKACLAPGLGPSADRALAQRVKCF